MRKLETTLIYSKSSPQCQAIKMFLKLKGVQYTGIDYDEMDELDKGVIPEVPMLVHGEETLLGYNPDDLSRLFG